MRTVLSKSRAAVLRRGGALAVAAAAFFGSAHQPVSTCGTLVGDRWIHVAARGESWGSIGARVGVEPAVLAARNGRTLRMPVKPGDALGIDNRHIVPPDDGSSLIVNVPQRLLFHYYQGAVRTHYPIAAGRPDWQTPLGPFTIAAMETEPTWDVPASIQEEMRRAGKPVVTKVPPGPANPLGRYWMGLSVGSIGLHGTNAPSSIYQLATHGCIRLHPDDAEDLFHRVAIGEQGRIVYEPVLVAFDGEDVFVEVHRDAYRRAPDALGRAMALLDRAGLLERADLAEVVRAVRDAEGLAVPVTRR